MKKNLKNKYMFMIALFLAGLMLCACTQGAGSLPMPPEMAEESTESVEETAATINQVEKTLQTLQEKKEQLETEIAEMESMIEQIKGSEGADQSLVETYTTRVEEKRGELEKTNGAIERYKRVRAELENNGYTAGSEELLDIESTPEAGEEIAAGSEAPKES